MKKTISIAIFIECLAATLCARPVQAQDNGSWKWQGTIYGYFPRISGTTNFPDGGVADASVDTDAILKHLKFAIMGSLEANKGRWGGYADIMYLNLGGSTSGTSDFRVGRRQIPVGSAADAHLD